MDEINLTTDPTAYLGSFHRNHDSRYTLNDRRFCNNTNSILSSVRYNSIPLVGQFLDSQVTVKKIVIVLTEPVFASILDGDNERKRVKLTYYYE